ncbi:hypothetical protein BDZ89DRAFT_1140424 [Hymenopellis radicata]|nr:hypothetical protein BDZ89DRAFT_1140424 [Hymenopellis radicata]
MSLLYGAYNTPPPSPAKKTKHHDPAIINSPPQVFCQLKYCVTANGKEPGRANRLCPQTACKLCCQMHLTRRVRDENLAELHCRVHHHKVLGADGLSGTPTPPAPPGPAHAQTGEQPPFTQQTHNVATPTPQSKNVTRSGLGRSAGPILVRAMSGNGFDMQSLGAHATRRPLSQPQENKVAALVKQQGRLIWVRIWNYNGSQRTAARPVLISKDMHDLYDVYADAKACRELNITQRGQPFWVWKVFRATPDNPGGPQWGEVDEPIKVTMGSVVDLTVVRDYFPSPPPTFDSIAKTSSEVETAVRTLTLGLDQAETDEPALKRMKLSHEPSTATILGACQPFYGAESAASLPGSRMPIAESSDTTHDRVSSPARQANLSPMDDDWQTQIPLTPAPFGTRSDFPFTYAQDMVEFCDLYKALPGNRQEAFNATVEKLLKPNEAHPKYHRSTVDDQCRYLREARTLADRLARMGRVPGAEWRLVRERALALRKAGNQ